MTKTKATGQLGLDYAAGREKKASLIYRLRRRTDEVRKSIRQFGKNEPTAIIDLGTADGRMLNTLHQDFPKARCVGIEYNPELVKLAKRLFQEVEFFEGDVSKLSVPDASFDVAIATAVIEHVPDPAAMVREVHRVLGQGGLFIVTSPAPFWEKIATAIGHLQDDQHNEVMNLAKLKKIISENDFSILKAEKFMLSPVGMPLELTVERMVRAIGCDFLFANQLVVAKKK
jgi:trans-aconitate methyltransferase